MLARHGLMAHLTMTAFSRWGEAVFLCHYPNAQYKTAGYVTNQAQKNRFKPKYQ
jgi:hypothetical protein